MSTKAPLFFIAILLLISSASATVSYYETWNYTGVDVPEASTELFMFNLWIYDNVPPSEEIEVVISNFTFVGDNIIDGGTPAGSFEWAGYTWTKRNMTLSSPGPNYWNSSNAWIDANDKLHLKISHVGSSWHCAEIETVDSLGYGTYSCTIESDLELEPNVVLGIFTFKDDGNETDIEFSRWGDAGANDSAYTVQPGHTHSFNTELTDGYNESTHGFTWLENNINWFSLYGTPASYSTAAITPINTTFNNVTGTTFLDLDDSSPETVNISIPGALYTPGAPTANLYGFWPLNGTATDYNSGTRHNGTVTGTLAYSSKGAYFDGNDYTTTVDMANPAWIAFDINTTIREQDIISHWEWDDQCSWLLTETASGFLELAVSDDGTDFTEYYTSAALQANTEHHIDLIFNGSTAYIYLDGVRVMNQAMGFSTLYNTNSVYYIGYENFYVRYRGYLKNIRYYSTAPSEATRMQLLNNGSGVSVKAQPFGDWTLYTGGTMPLSDFGDMLAGLSYIDTSAGTYDVTITETYNLSTPPEEDDEPITVLPGVHEGYWMEWNGTALNFNGTTPTDNSTWIGNELEITIQ